MLEFVKQHIDVFYLNCYLKNFIQTRMLRDETPWHNMFYVSSFFYYSSSNYQVLINFTEWNERQLDNSRSTSLGGRGAGGNNWANKDNNATQIHTRVRFDLKQGLPFTIPVPRLLTKAILTIVWIKNVWTVVKCFSKPPKMEQTTVIINWIPMGYETRGLGHAVHPRRHLVHHSK